MAQKLHLSHILYILCFTSFEWSHSRFPPPLLPALGSNFYKSWSITTKFECCSGITLHFKNSYCIMYTSFTDHVENFNILLSTVYKAAVILAIMWFNWMWITAKVCKKVNYNKPLSLKCIIWHMKTKWNSFTWNSFTWMYLHNCK